MNNLTVRTTQPYDFGTVYNVIQTDFQTAEHSDGDEQNFAANLRNSKNHIPELDLVAEIDSKIVGHIMLTQAYVTRHDGTRYDILLVAPLSVLLEFRNLGIGGDLMREGLRRASEAGYGAAILLGDPEYYKRLGFHPASDFGITHQEFPADYLLAHEIIPGALQNGAGVVSI